MELEIRLYNHFKAYAPGQENVFNISLAPGDTLGDVLKALKIPPDIPAVTLLNGRRVTPDTPIQTQSSLALFDPVSGG